MGLIPHPAEELREEHLVKRQPAGSAVHERHVDAGVGAIAASQERRARRAANWLHIVVLQLDAVCGERVQIRRADNVCVVAVRACVVGDVVVAIVVGQYKDDVRRCGNRTGSAAKNDD